MIHGRTVLLHSLWGQEYKSRVPYISNFSLAVLSSTWTSKTWQQWKKKVPKAGHTANTSHRNQAGGTQKEDGLGLHLSDTMCLSTLQKLGGCVQHEKGISEKFWTQKDLATWRGKEVPSGNTSEGGVALRFLSAIHTENNIQRCWVYS